MGHSASAQPNPRRTTLFTVFVIAVALLLLGVEVVAVANESRQRRVREATIRRRCYKNLRQIGIAVTSYLDDRRAYPHVARSPSGRGAIWLLIARGYLDHDPEVLTCPYDDSGSVGYEGFTHGWSVDVRGRTPIAWDRQVHPDGKRTVLLADGAVELVNEADFQEAFVALTRQIDEARRR